MQGSSILSSLTKHCVSKQLESLNSLHVSVAEWLHAVGCNPSDVGSIPTGNSKIQCSIGAVVAHLFGKEEVLGSIPRWSTKYAGLM